MHGSDCDPAIQVWVSPLPGCHGHALFGRGDLALVGDPTPVRAVVTGTYIVIYLASNPFKKA